MRNTKVFRETLPAYFSRIPFPEFLKLLTCRSPRDIFVRESTAILGREVRGLGRGHSRKYRSHIFLTKEGLSNPFQPLGGQTIRQNSDYFLPELRVSRRRCQQLFSGSLIKSDGMKFNGGDAPPARKRGAYQKLWHQVFPN